MIARDYNAENPFPGASKPKCLINAAVSMGRRNTKLKV